MHLYRMPVNAGVTVPQPPVPGNSSLGNVIMSLTETMNSSSSDEEWH